MFTVFSNKQINLNTTMITPSGIVGDVPTPSIWQKRTEAYKTTTEISTRLILPWSTLREFPGEISRHHESILYRGDIDKVTEPVATTLFKLEQLKEIMNRERDKIIQDIDRERDTLGERKETQEREETRETGIIRPILRPRDREIERDSQKDIITEEQARRKAIFKKEKEMQPLDWPKKHSFQRPYGRQGNENPPAESESGRDLEQVIPIKGSRRQSAQPQEPRVVEVYRPTVGEDASDSNEPETETESGFRSRWQQTRSRPKRPGANALLHTSTAKATKKPALSVIKLDKEDIEQLFRDTGFNLDWRKQTT